MPRHVNPTQAERTATAPYNFIPLPESIFTVEEGITQEGKQLKPWERRDEFVPGTSSGCIDLEITTLTPLYIRGPVCPQQQHWDERDSRVRPEPFSTPDGRPVIPGSTLRGAIRTLVEILSFSKIRPVTCSKPFFRDISPSRISTEYRKHFVEDLGQLSSGIDIQTNQQVRINAPGYAVRVRAGFIDIRSRTIRECEFARVERQTIQKAFPSQNLQDGSGPMATPSWNVQHKPCYVDVDDKPRDYFFARQIRNGRQRHPNLYLRFRKVHQLFASKTDGLINGTIVLTGNVPQKHLEFIFLNETCSKDIQVPDSVWHRFHDDDQITQWQEKAFPRNQPPNGGRRKPGALRNDEPVFFLTDDSKKSKCNPDGLVFLGRAQLFRFPYDMSPNDLVPDNLRQASLDLAEVLFGYVRQGKDSNGTTLKGRVFFEDAVAFDGGPPWTEETLVPRILSAPKPTAFQHYLTQDDAQNVRNLKTYLAGDSTTIRGHKLYWHRWNDPTGLDDVREPADQKKKLADLIQGHEALHTQHTIIQPVKTGVRFTSRVRFENLTDVELGALLTALELPESCAHKVGMGKPLGLGSVRIRATLHVIDRELRYRTWESDGAIGDIGRRFRDAFETAMLKHAKASGESLILNAQGLRQIGRLDALFLMLEWRERPNSQFTRQISELRKFRKRPVLPTPHKVAGQNEPSWRNDRPSPAASSQPENRQPANIAPQRQTVAAPPTQLKHKPVQKGQTRQGKIFQVRGNWIARFDGDSRDAEIVNSKMIPNDAIDGMSAEFYVMRQSKKEGIQVRFERRK